VLLDSGSLYVDAVKLIVVAERYPPVLATQFKPEIIGHFWL
jgi:hypothetical protein